MDAKAVPAKPVQIKCVSHWCDQLQGPKTAQLILKLLRNGAVVKEHDLFGIFQRGEDLKYIHWADLKGEEIVTAAQPGDEYQLFTISGENGEYKEDEEVEGTIPYNATVRVFML